MDKRHACKHGNTDVVYCYQRANHVAYRLVYVFANKVTLTLEALIIIIIIIIIRMK